ncbi:TRAP transporter substrate-binding protein [Candidatus Aalborgicola defluviihabitans]|uniref:TRAP transporter substrate-binding protein n=1 Tax=Candidatus Aalborgicola defluviihabitans TaxID=3386187 RepID=UPI001DD727DA|nr:TRAP transporter substrate-binding protein [Burkholderiales bacterium]
MTSPAFVRTLLAAITLTACASAAWSQEVVLKVAHFLPPGSTAHAKFITPWCDKINKESAGKLKCQIYPAMQLGGTPPQLIDQARDGIADIVWTLPGYSAGRFPAVEAFELPFMTKTAEGSSRALWEYVQVNKLDQTEFKDVHPILFHVHDKGQLHLVKGPIKTMADFKGLKLRAPTRQTNKFLAALGATPVGMPVPQVSDALSKGVIDGAMLPWEVVPSVKVQELVKFHSESDPNSRAMYTTAFIFAMNKAKYDSLSPELKKVIDANSGAEASAWVGKVWDQSATGARKLAADRGNQFNTIGLDELRKWEQAGQVVVDSWVNEVTAKGFDGKSLLKSAHDLIQKYDPQ